MTVGYLLEIRVRRQPGVTLPEPADGCLLTFQNWEDADAYRQKVKLPTARIVAFDTECPR